MLVPRTKANPVVQATSSDTSSQCSNERTLTGRRSIGGRRRLSLHLAEEVKRQPRAKALRPTWCPVPPLVSPYHKDDPSHLTNPELLDQHFERHNRKRVARRTLPSGLKSAPLYGTVKEVWDAYQEAEDPRQVLEQMRSQARFPWKVLAFDQQIRPPYSGRPVD